MDSFRRKTPEQILASISKLQQGKLKIYIGAVNGSGKTYHMLLEGQSLQAEGIDVVICAVSTMKRPETAEKLGTLERVPSIRWDSNGIEQKDLNLEALLQRNPEVVLVDGLAHRNRPGAQFATRLEDIQYLLQRGISVITTVNVYELDGVTLLAHRLTGIRAENTIPVQTLELADEVRLIDVTPETMLQRLSEGNLNGVKDVPLMQQRGNLGVLRELALRLMAVDVNGSLEKHRESQGLTGPSGANERVIVCVQYRGNSSAYIRRGQQIAKRLNGELNVISFVKEHAVLTKEESMFKRMMLKLTDRIGAHTHELPFNGRRQIPKLLSKYAMKYGVTRIVLGHSKHSRWKELLYGSIVNGILGSVRNADVLFVADHVNQSSEQKLVETTSARGQTSKSYRRLSEQEVAQQTEALKRGTFKVYIGAAPGVGKTYTMLREGNELLRKGIDVVIGLLETHGRADTAAQIGSLPILPEAEIEYCGAKLHELDVQAIIERNPEVVLIDELAHTNVPGIANKKRYEDVMEILAAGISVITTMNVQHLESLNDSVEQITGIRVRETVPDSVLQSADEVELIDVAPAALQQRMREGRIYAANKIDQALGHFFRTGNLIALRELVLREIADDVDERLEAREHSRSLRGPWRGEERIFVAVTLSLNAERLIRQGFRLAHRLKAQWHVMYVHPAKQLSEKDQKRLASIQQLTERLGGSFELAHTRLRRRVASALLERANALNSTQMIVGQTSRRWRLDWCRRSVIKTIVQQGRNLDVLVAARFEV
ncbi:two-component system sensor histidine kinase KdpD [Paenibacillus cellulosilyticus]|uniref:Two-component system sensor histidine kinase KdpD n=1 Tax=Paenibacillus cellulosilyticus TaxID=375489 RepID=A0A2V2YYJ4_9BACL|nr:universal stress protein [Paenibacillus cellulosilyticus]PWW04802.1 two-component system sensor histidine kinase KdpD [Paenibacillus cellulosilyticus]QKS45923.1 universal stress protein [Paenibacillus cellulosilyticus]